MRLYLVKSDIVKARYFFAYEEKALALLTELLSQFGDDGDDITMKYLSTSDEWEISQLVEHFKQSKELL